MWASKPVFGVCEPQVHPCRLVSAFVIPLLESIIHVSKFATSEISIFYLLSVAEQAGMCMTWSEDRFSCDKAHIAYGLSIPSICLVCLDSKISHKLKRLSRVYINNIFESKIVNIFLSINFNICYGCSKEPSH